MKYIRYAARRFRMLLRALRPANVYKLLIAAWPGYPTCICFLNIYPWQPLTNKHVGMLVHISASMKEKSSKNYYQKRKNSGFIGLLAKSQITPDKIQPLSLLLSIRY